MGAKVEICGIDTDTLPKITGKECEQLLREYFETGSKQARDRLVLSNVRLVLSIVQRYYEYKGSFDDLFQAGMVGLLKAVDNFDLTQNVRFSTYAVPMIVGEVRKQIRESNSLKVGRATRDVAYRSMQARERICETNPFPTMDEIARELALPVIEVMSALDAVCDPISLYSNVGKDDDDGMLLLDKIKDNKNTEDSLMNKVILKDAMASLGEKERKVIIDRYYVGKTQTEIAQSENISQAQVSRLEKNALRKMRAFF